MEDPLVIENETKRRKKTQSKQIKGNVPIEGSEMSFQPNGSQSKNKQEK